MRNQNSAAAVADSDVEPMIGVPTAGISSVAVVPAVAKALDLTQGLYRVQIGEAGASHRRMGTIEMPATQITSTPSEGGATLELLGTGMARDGWIGAAGGTIVLKVPEPGAHVLITTYRATDQEASPVEIQISRLDLADLDSVSAAPPALRAAANSGALPIETEIVLHIERVGDQRFIGGDWSGNCGGKRRVEAFSIRPIEALLAADIEYKAFGPNGRETPWVSDAKLCGSRGRGMPITGFAVQVSERLRERFDVVYEASFFESGVTGPFWNGAPCKGHRQDDPLEAVRIRLTERVS